MVSRLNTKTGQRFWGCAQFPECRGTRDTDGRSANERHGERRPGGFGRFGYDVYGEPADVDESALPSDRQRRNDRRRYDSE